MRFGGEGLQGWIGAEMIYTRQGFFPKSDCLFSVFGMGSSKKELFRRYPSALSRLRIDHLLDVILNFQPSVSYYL